MLFCFATNNQHKLDEVKYVVPDMFQILSLKDINCHDELPETKETLEGNSLQKAEYVFNHYKIPCFADDTGLEVEVLNNAPGVYSARYAGLQRNSEDNVRLLLQNMVQKENRKARFRTVITLVGVEQEALFFEGIVEGLIAHEPKGTQGFGYDPVFIPNGYNHTFAEMGLDQKNIISHRAIAVKKLVAYLKNRKTG